MDINNVKIGMKVELLGKHAGCHHYDNINDWYKDVKHPYADKIKEQGYAVVTEILNKDIVCIDHANTNTDAGWYFLSNDLNPFYKFKVGDRVRVKNIPINTTSEYGEMTFLEDFTKFVDEEYEVISYTKQGNVRLSNDFFFAEEWLEIVESTKKKEELLLPIGTKIKMIKPKFGLKDVLRGLFEVIEADNTHVFARYEQGIWIDCSITKQELEEYWEVVEEKKGKWDDIWHSHGLVQYKVHSNGKKVKVKIASGDVGVAICANGDEFDLEKGISIAKNRAIIKKLEKQINKLSK